MEYSRRKTESTISLSAGVYLRFLDERDPEQANGAQIE
jgi:hypothetical protein